MKPSVRLLFATWMWCTSLWCLSQSTLAAELPAAVAGGDRPCAEDSRELADATKELDALDQLIRNLKPVDNPAAANDALLALSRHRCMLLARVGADQLRAEAAPALQEFWENGGKYWIESYLGLARIRQIQFPPPMRKVVSTETRPGHPMLSLLCPLADQACGKETAGWWQRADAYFRLKAAPIPRLNPAATPFDRAPVLTEKTCSDEAIAAPEAERYSAWERCVGDLRSVGFVMPLGRVKAPISGWLVVRGRRGHYSYCDEFRIYSLATGAAYISQSCSQLMQLIAGNGNPDRNRQVLRGMVSVDNTRELAWMLLQLGEPFEDFVNRDSYNVPAGIEPIKGWENPFMSGRRQKLQMVSSDQTMLAWALIGASGEHLVSGQLRWPGDYLGGPNDHAVALLQIAEAGFTTACPDEKPPADINLGAARPVVSALDANPAELSQAERNLVTDLHREAGAECRVQR